MAPMGIHHPEDFQRHLGRCWLFACAVFSDGRVCISILHSPGDDPMGYETAAERWSPVQSVRATKLYLSATLL